MKKYVNRDIEKVILGASKNYPVVLLCGSRQVGKSTLLNNIKEDKRRMITLDDYQAKALADNDPALFFETYAYPILIDEFQRSPSLLLEIKKIVDEKRLKGENANGLFWLTGSQKFKMMKNVSESLAGRIAIYDLASFSQNEIRKNHNGLFKADLNSLKSRIGKYKSVHEIFKAIYKGGMPSIIVNKLERDEYYRNYINTYLERDIRDLAQVGHIDEFYQFLVYMASNTSHEIKYDSIAKEVGVSVPTIKNWINILESSGIIYILRPYYAKAVDRLVKTPKFYFMDTGLAAYLTRWPDYLTLENGAMAGAYFETYVISEIVKSYYNNGRELNLYYYRDIDKKEIDLLIVEGDKIYPIEIKKAKNPLDADKNIKALDKFKMKVQPMIVICMSNELIPLNKDCYLFPVSRL